MTNQQLKEFLELDRSSLPEDGGDRFNRLIFSSSPYLLQHSTNPVDWREWNQQSLDEARERNLPLFVSIGYATCHWCHVMAEESFQDPDLADLLNHAFIPVKVDREERPDLDRFCMAACQTMNRSGGWPLNCFLKPDCSPFYALTYLPREPRGGNPGFFQLLEHIARLWLERPELIDENGAALLAALKQGAEVVTDAVTPDLRQLVKEGVRDLKRIYDPLWHGFGNRPKFPMPSYLLFLLRQPEPEQRQMAVDSLLTIRQGGIYDQLAGGIHRYSTDRKWQVPHFEKMLYDQAMVAFVSLEGYRITADDRLLELATGLIEFVLRDLQHDEGGFYSGIDADSEGAEGSCYIWKKGEIEQILGGEAKLFCHCYGVTEQGNFEGTGANVLYLADQTGIEQLHDARRRLLAQRKRREQPLRDIKVVTAWNGMMIAALARGAAITGNRRWRAAAVSACSFIFDQLFNRQGRLLRSWCRSPAATAAFLEDYAALAWGCLELYSCCHEECYLQRGELLCRDALTLFRDHDQVLQSVGNDQPQLPVRLPDNHDGVTPSGSSMLLLNLFRLAGTSGQSWRGEAEKLLQRQLQQVGAGGLSHLWLLTCKIVSDNGGTKWTTA